MKYHIVVDIPESDVLDTRLPAKVSYMVNDSGKLVVKETEGDLDFLRPLERDSVELLSLELKDEDVLLVRFPSDSNPIDVEEAKLVIQSEFPDHKVLMITKDLDLLSRNPKEAINLLEKMIAHIKIVNI